MKEKSISIIILNWNSMRDTIECLKSLSKIDYENYNVFVLDNNSSEDISKLKEYTRKDQKINLYINNQNDGFAKGNNFSVSKVLSKSPDYILLLNNDTVVDKFFLKNLVSEMKKDVGIVSPLVYDYYKEDMLSENDSPGRFNLKNGGGTLWNKNLQSLNFENKSFAVDYASGCCWLIKPNLIKKLGLFNEKFFAYAEEIDFAMRMKKTGLKFLINPTSKIWHKGSVSSSKISGFKIYYSTRNMIWLERIHANKIEFLIFLFNLVFWKVPKNILKSFNQNNKVNFIKKFFLGVVDGFLKKNEEFNSPKYYKL